MKEVSRAFITNEKGEVLLGKRIKGINTGFYSLIGGKPEIGETAECTIIREVKEETGLDFIPIFYFSEINSSTGEPWKVSYFTGSVEGELKLKKDEIEDIIYVDRQNLDKIEIAFDQKEKLNDFFQRNYFK